MRRSATSKWSREEHITYTKIYVWLYLHTQLSIKQIWQQVNKCWIQVADTHVDMFIMKSGSQSHMWTFRSLVRGVLFVQWLGLKDVWPNNKKCLHTFNTDRRNKGAGKIGKNNMMYSQYMQLRSWTKRAMYVQKPGTRG